MFYKFILNMVQVGSTIQASKKRNISKIYSIESDIVWFNKIRHINHQKFHIYF